MTFTVVFSDTTEVEVYGGLAACDAYMFTSGSPGAAAYRGLAVDSDNRKRLLVDATRFVDAQEWQGEANEADGTMLAFPRTTEDTSEAIANYDNAQQLTLVVQAVFELVAIAATNRSALDALDASSNIKSAGAGQNAVEVEFFAPTSIAHGTATKLPVVAQRLLGRFLVGDGAAAVSVSVGGSSASSCRGSSFDRNDTLRRRDPF